MVRCLKKFNSFFNIYWSNWGDIPQCRFIYVFPILSSLCFYLILNICHSQQVSSVGITFLPSLPFQNERNMRNQMFGSSNAPITVGFAGFCWIWKDLYCSNGAAISSIFPRCSIVNQTTRITNWLLPPPEAMSLFFKQPIAAIIFAIEVFSLDIWPLPPVAFAIGFHFWNHNFLTFFFGSDVLLPFKIEDDLLYPDVFFFFLGIVCGPNIYLFHRSILNGSKKYSTNKDSPSKATSTGCSYHGVL